jgi:hypothetical protein
MTSFSDKVVACCEAELERWRDSAANQTEDPYCGIIGEYWLKGLGYKWDGRTQFVDENGRRFTPPWSAAFVSYIYRRAGAGNAFCYAEAHIHYIINALRNVRSAHGGSRFFARDPARYAPKIGDILCMARHESRVTYATLEDHYGPSPVPNGRFLACHADIVVSSDAKRRWIRTIGGNRGAGRVADEILALDREARVRSRTLLCIIECMM